MADERAGTLSVIDDGATPRVSRDGTRVDVTGTLENNVATLDAATLAPLGSVAVGRGPNGISLRDGRGGVQ